MQMCQSGLALHISSSPIWTGLTHLVFTNPDWPYTSRLHQSELALHISSSPIRTGLTHLVFTNPDWSYTSSFFTNPDWPYSSLRLARVSSDRSGLVAVFVSKSITTAGIRTLLKKLKSKGCLRSYIYIHVVRKYCILSLTFTVCVTPAA